MKNVSRKSQSRFSLFGDRRGRRGAAPSRRSGRRLGSELLEERRLLAGLTGVFEANGLPTEVLRSTATPYQNPVINTDVDGNGETEVRDLLVEINALRSNGPGVLGAAAGEGETGAAASVQTTFVDVNGDNSLTLRDALDVVGALRAEPENGAILKITPEIVDRTTKEPITSVDPGDQFIVRVSSDDLRDGMVPDNSLGAVTLAFEVVFPNDVGAQFNAFEFPVFDATEFNPNAVPQSTMIYDTFGGLIQNPTQTSPGVIEVNLSFSISALGLFGDGPTQVDPAVLGMNLPVVDLIFTATAAGEGGLDAVNDDAMTPEDTAVDVPVLDNDTTGEIEFETRYPTFEQNEGNKVSNTIPGGMNMPLPEDQMMFGVDRLGVPAAATITNVSDPANGTAVLQANNTIRYTPDDDFSGMDTFTYTISNGLTSDTATVTVEVAGVNDAPNAVNDNYSTQEETPLTRNVLDNDTDADGDALTVTQVNGNAANVGVQIDLANGTLTLNANGQFTYTPDPGFTDGTETFTYQITDGELTDNAMVTIRVGLPAATNDEFNIMEDMEATLDVTDNDEVNVGQTADITAVTNPANGAVAIVTVSGREQIRYTPDPDFFGTDTFTYTISDTLGEATATVTVNVANKNDPPSAVNDNVSVDEDTTTTLDVLANDTFLPDPQETLTITNVSTPSEGGTATIVNGGAEIEYTPADNFFGTETFTYTINDGNGGTDTATVTVTVRNVNDDPTAVNDQAQVIIAQGPIVLDVLANDTFDPDPQETLTITAVNTNINQPGGGQFRGTVQIINNGTAIRYTPVDGGEGTFRFEYTISDGNGGTDTATVTLNVLAAIPSTISGRIYVDKDNDGLVDAGFDLGLAGVQVLLQGVNQNGAPVGQPLVAITDALGRYTFNNVLPIGVSAFKIIAPTLGFMVDGQETAGGATNTNGGAAPSGFSSTVTGNNEITVRIPILGDVITTENNFAVRGLDPNFVGLADIIAQGDQYHGAGLVSLNQNGSIAFAVGPTSGGWEQVSSISVSLSSNGTNATITAVMNGQLVQSTIPLNTVLNGSGAHVKVIGSDSATGARLVRFFGSPSDLGLSGDGEGESDDYAQAADAVFAAGF